MSNKERIMSVTYFQRKPREGFSFSLEYMFKDIRLRLKDRITAEVKICRFHNNGLLTKVYNTIEAACRQGREISHVTGEVHFLNLFMRKKKVVLTILDCGMMHRKKGLAKKIVHHIYLKWPVKAATVITCVSEKTKSEIVEYTNCNADKIKVIPNCVDEIYQPYQKAFNAEKPNILQIGVSYNKNLIRLIQSLEGINCELTIVGKLGEDHLAELKKRSIEYNNHYNLSQHEILQKYINCDILAFVSTFEGFGMPIIEANSVERPVITSNISSMPEVATDAACLIDPYDINSIREGFKKIITDSNYRNQLITNGRKNKLRFNPQQIANCYLEIYRKLTEGSQDVLLKSN